MNIDNSDESQSDRGFGEDQRDGVSGVDQRDKGEPVMKKVRGSTKMRALITRHQEQRERLHVDFNTNMNPIGDEEDRFISYLGYLARSKVRIMYLN